MLTKSQSCNKCTNHFNKTQGQTQTYKKIIKKPESYLSKKFEQLYQQDKKLRDKKLNKMEQYIKQKQQKQVQGCTFKPQINNNPEYHIAQQSFLKREQNWKKNIEKKKSEKRQEKSKKEIDGLTFQPKIIDVPLTSSQIKATKGITSKTIGYSKKTSLVQKKSYKVIHNERKKLQQVTKIKTIQPFKHRKTPSTNINNMAMNYENENNLSIEINNKNIQTINIQANQFQQSKEQKQGGQAIAKQQVRLEQDDIKQEQQTKQQQNNNIKQTQDVSKQLQQSSKQVIINKQKVVEQVQTIQNIKNNTQQSENFNQTDQRNEHNAEIYQNQIQKINQVSQKNNELQQLENQEKNFILPDGENDEII